MKGKSYMRILVEWELFCIWLIEYIILLKINQELYFNSLI